MAKTKETPKKAGPALYPVEELAEQLGVAAWELAGLMRAARWAEGKQVSEAEFTQALQNLRSRPLGGGVI